MKERRIISFLMVLAILAVTLVTLTGCVTLTGISLGTGAWGDTVTLTGSGFGAAQGTSKVYFGNGVPAPASVPASNWSDGRIICEVPGGSKTGGVYVVVGKSNSNSLNFTVDMGQAVLDLDPDASVSRLYVQDKTGGTRGLIQGETNWTYDRFGQSDKALAFTGNGMVKIQSDASMRYLRGFAITMNVRIPESSKQMTILRKQDCFKLETYDVGAGQQLKFIANDGTSSYWLTTNPSVDPIPHVAVNIALTFNAKQSKMRLWIEGKKLVEQTVNPRKFVSSLASDVTIGANADLTNKFEGDVDDLTIYDIGADDPDAGAKTRDFMTSLYSLSSNLREHRASPISSAGAADTINAINGMDYLNVIDEVNLLRMDTLLFGHMSGLSQALRPFSYSMTGDPVNWYSFVQPTLTAIGPSLTTIAGWLESNPQDQRIRDIGYRFATLQENVSHLATDLPSYSVDNDSPRIDCYTNSMKIGVKTDINFSVYENPSAASWQSGIASVSYSVLDKNNNPISNPASYGLTIEGSGYTAGSFIGPMSTSFTVRAMFNLDSGWRTPPNTKDGFKIKLTARDKQSRPTDWTQTISVQNTPPATESVTVNRSRVPDHDSMNNQTITLTCSDPDYNVSQNVDIQVRCNWYGLGAVLVNPHPDDWYDVGKDEYCGSVTKNYTIQMSFNNLSRTQTATADLFPNTSIVDEMWAKMPTGWVTPAAIINVRATARDSFGAGGSGGKAFYWLHNLNSSYNPQMANVQIENSASPGMKVVAESVDDLRNLSVKYDVLDPDGNLRNIHIVVMGDPVAGGVCGCTIPASSLGLSQTSTSWQTNKRLYPFSASFTDTNALFNKINRSYYGSGKSCTIELNVAASDVDQNISEPGADQFYVNDKASFNLKVRGEGDDTYGLSVGDQLVPTPVSGNGIQSISLILPKFPDPNEPNVRLLRVTDTSSGVDTSVDDIGLWLESKARFSLGNTYRYLPASGTGGAAWSDQLDVSQCP